MICKISLDKTEKVRYNIGNVKYQNGNGSPHRKPTGGSVKTCYHINVLNIYVFKGGADIWQNAISAEKKLFLVLRSPIHIEDLTEHGNLMSNVLKRSSTVLLREFTPAPVACVLIRLPVRYNLFLKVIF